MIITFTLQSTTDGSLLTGKANSTAVFLSQDYGAYVQASNSVTEIGRGEYKLELTTAESTYNTELHYQPVCSGAMTNTYAIGKDLEAKDVWNYTGDAVNNTPLNTLNNVTAIKAKTDNLPTAPASTSDVTGAVTSIEQYGDTNWLTATGFAEPGDAMTLTTAYDSAKTAVNQVGVTTALTSYGTCKTSDLSGISVTATVSTADKTDIAEKVWENDERTLTDLTPRPNEQSITCAVSDVENSYGIIRLQSWSGETQGTTAYTTIINSYISQAKQKIATDVNNHVNQAISYIGSATMTELCAGLAGYLLYKDDESATTDNLAETRYVSYCSIVHRINENI